MRINEAKIKQQVKKAIAIKPTHIQLKRYEKQSNGMRGGTGQEVDVAELDVFLDHSKHSDSRSMGAKEVSESGELKKIKGIAMIAVTDGFEIKDDDFFIINGLTYKVNYNGLLVKDVYNSAIEVIK